MTRSQSKFGNRWTRLVTATLILAFSVNGVARAQGIAAGLPGAERAVSQNIIQQLAGKKAKPKTQPTSKKPVVTARTKFTHEQIAHELKYSTCFIIVRKGRKIHTGTGWILDLERRLIITNFHVINSIRNNGPPDEILCYFPEKDSQGEWITDRKHYLKNVRASKATIITSTTHHDLAVVQVDRIPNGLRALPLAKKSPVPGSQLHSLGGKPAGSETMWIYSSGRVRQVGNRHNALGRMSRMVECQLAINKGNSGGPIVNDYLEIVAVVEGGNFQTNGHAVLNVTFHVDVEQVRSYLSDALPLVNASTAKQYHDRGVSHMNAKRNTAAIRDFSSAIRQDSKFAKSYGMRGWAFYHKGDNRTALADFDQAISLDATNAHIFHGRGMAKKSMKKYDEAIRDFSNAIRFSPEDATHYNQRGIATMYARDVKSSYKDFVQATQLEAKNGIYFANRAYAARLIGLYDDSVSSYSTALNLRGANHIYYNGLGLALMGQKKYGTAQKAFLLAIKRHKKVTGKEGWIYYRNLGKVLHLAKDLKNAHGILSKAIELSPKMAELYYLRGRVAKDLGRNDLAAKDFRMAVNLDSKTYGRLAGSGNGNGGRVTDVSTATSNGRTVTSKSDSRVIGVWRCVGTYKGTRMRIGAAFTKDGYFAFHFRAANGGESKFSGKFLAKGGKISIKTPNGKVESYRYGFHQGQLWIDVQGTGVALYFTRKS